MVFHRRSILSNTLSILYIIAAAMDVHLEVVMIFIYVIIVKLKQTAILTSLTLTKIEPDGAYRLLLVTEIF